jgi:hypothetical protein
VEAQELAEKYRWYHKNVGKLNGGSTILSKKQIKKYIDEIKPTTILDYGCGGGSQYTKKKCHEYWGVDLPYMYDPYIEKYSIKPTGHFDLVLCLDVLECLHYDEFHDVLDEVCSFGDAIYFKLDTRKANKELRGGTNMHTILNNEDWWHETLEILVPEDKKMVISFEFDRNN